MTRLGDKGAWWKKRVTLSELIDRGECPVFKQACEIAESSDEVVLTRSEWRALQKELPAFHRDLANRTGIMGKPIAVRLSHM